MHVILTALRPFQIISWSTGGGWMRTAHFSSPVVRTSALSSLNFRVESPEFYSCVFDFELPVDSALFVVDLL